MTYSSGNVTAVSTVRNVLRCRNVDTVLTHVLVLELLMQDSGTVIQNIADSVTAYVPNMTSSAVVRRWF